MNKKMFYMFFVLGAFVLNSSVAAAEEEFVVDLSVLGDVSSNTMPYESAVPVAEDNNHPLLIKNNLKSSSSVSSILNLPPLEPKFPVVTAKPAAPKTVKPKKIRPAKPVSKPVVAVAEKAPEKIEVEETLETQTPEIQETPETPETPIQETPVDEVVNEAPVAFETTEDLVVSEVGEEGLDDISEKTIVYEFNENEDVVVSDGENAEVSEIAPSSEGEYITEEDFSNSEELVMSQHGEVVDIEETLPTPQDLGDSIISFAADSTEISDTDKSKIDAIIKSFEDANSNRIGIVSYNVESSGISFKNKRQSLARATNIRSYLISKGYKNFDIKVAEVAENSSMANCVEISEIK